MGSTPTAVHGKSFEGITEVRCGVYMFCDVFQSEIQSCGPEDIAVSVLATVIGHRPDMNSALIDAGALALSKDRSTGAPGLPEDVGYGLVMDATATRRIDRVRVGHVYQEHGMLVSDGPFPFAEVPVGSKVRVMPNHACMTSAMYDSYHVVDGVDDFRHRRLAAHQRLVTPPRGGRRLFLRPPQKESAPASSTAGALLGTGPGAEGQGKPFRNGDQSRRPVAASKRWILSGRAATWMVSPGRNGCRSVSIDADPLPGQRRDHFDIRAGRLDDFDGGGHAGLRAAPGPGVPA